MSLASSSFFFCGCCGARGVNTGIDRAGVVLLDVCGVVGGGLVVLVCVVEVPLDQLEEPAVELGHDVHGEPDDDVGSTLVLLRGGEDGDGLDVCNGQVGDVLHDAGEQSAADPPVLRVLRDGGELHDKERHAGVDGVHDEGGEADDADGLDIGDRDVGHDFVKYQRRHEHHQHHVRARAGGGDSEKALPGEEEACADDHVHPDDGLHRCVDDFSQRSACHWWGCVCECECVCVCVCAGYVSGCVLWGSKGRNERPVRFESNLLY